MESNPTNRPLGRVAIDQRSTRLRFYLSLIIGVLSLAACSRSVSPPPDIPPTEPPALQWSSQDIGQVSIPGDANFINHQHVVVQGSGEDIWGTADSFHFAYQAFQGDGAITARVVSIDNTHEWAKAGVMIREQLTANSKHALVALTPQGIVEFNRRLGIGDPTSNNQRQIEGGSRWVRLVRQGDTFSAYESADGAVWRPVYSTEIVMAHQVYVGLAVTSRDNSQLAQGVLEQVNVQALPNTDPDPDPNPEPMIRTAYDRDFSDFPNPERGFYSYINLLTGRDFSGLAVRGLTLGHAYVRLDNYRYQPLPEYLLTNLRQGFAAARSAGIKVILRFSYNFGFDRDTPLNNVLQHIDQLAPLLHENQDVIAVLQAGFIGAWGEWHGSTYGLTTPANREAIANALLQALPPSRMIQIRYPRYIRDLYPTPLSSDQAFTISNQARTGHHNDCLLTNASDAGTYLSEQDRWYAEQISQFIAIGGETCDLGGVSERNSCANALAELNRFNWDYLNHEFWRPLIDVWQAQGCYQEMRQRLGYRLRLIEAAISRQASQGGSLTLELRITNDGFGKVYNPRPMEVVLRHTGTRSEHVIRLANDARMLLPLSGETRNLTFNIALPNSVAVGSYEVFLRLPDPAPSLNSRPQYSIRLANVGTWEASSGYNALLLTVAVAP